MSADCKPSLETRVSVLETRIDHQKQLVDEQRSADQRALVLMRLEDQKALELQRSIDQRHFESLNGEQARLAKFQTDHLRREVFDVYKEQMDKQIGELREYRANIEGRIWMVGSILGVFGGVVGYVIHLTMK